LLLQVLLVIAATAVTLVIMPLKRFQKLRKALLLVVATDDAQLSVRKPTSEYD
jgi:hypothetical protein